MSVRDPESASSTEAKRSESYPPGLYRSVHGERNVDKAFYQAVVRGGTSVLELGCGHGRIAEAMRAECAHVSGVDLSVTALEEARGRVPDGHFVEADMRSFELDERFDRIVCPYNGVYCLLEVEDLRAMLRRVYEHLVPGGLFVFDGYAADGFHAQGGDEEESEESFVRRVKALGTDWDVYESSTWDRDSQRIDATYVHVPTDGRETREAEIPQRYLLRRQLESLLSEAGLELLVVHGDFDQSVWDEESPFLIVTAQRPLAEA
ncbi:MAG: SAM-dependent methyltransferase [Polyangiales bacterium]